MLRWLEMPVLACAAGILKQAGGWIRRVFCITLGKKFGLQHFWCLQANRRMQMSFVNRFSW